MAGVDVDGRSFVIADETRVALLLVAGMVMGVYSVGRVGCRGHVLVQVSKVGVGSR